jgi:hypothetical protein
VTFSHSTSRGHAARESRRSRETFSLGVCNLLLSDISYHCNEPGFNLSVLDVRGASRSRPAYKNSVGCVYAGRLRGGCVFAPQGSCPGVCVCSWCMLCIRLARLARLYTYIHAVTGEYKITKERHYYLLYRTDVALRTSPELRSTRAYSLSLYRFASHTVTECPTQATTHCTLHEHVALSVLK